MRIVICGVGALGGAAAVLLRNLGATLVLLDDDRVESKNTLSQVYVKQSIGKNKAEALKLQLANFYGTKAEAAPVRLVKTNVEALCASADLIVDAFDNQESRLVLSAFAREKQKPLVHAAVSQDGAFGLVRWDARFAPDAEDRPGQPTCEGGEHLPMLGVVSSALARAVQDFVVDGVQRDYVISKSGVTSFVE